MASRLASASTDSFKRSDQDSKSCTTRTAKPLVSSRRTNSNSLIHVHNCILTCRRSVRLEEMAIRLAGASTDSFKSSDQDSKSLGKRSTRGGLHASSDLFFSEPPKKMARLESTRTGRRGGGLAASRDGTCVRGMRESLRNCRGCTQEHSCCSSFAVARYVHARVRGAGVGSLRNVSRFSCRSLLHVAPDCSILLFSMLLPAATCCIPPLHPGMCLRLPPAS